MQPLRQRQPQLAYSRRKRPLGVTIVALIITLQGCVGIIASAVLLSDTGSTAATSLGIFGLIFSALYFILAFGLWKLQAWAFWTMVVLEILALLNGILGILGHLAAGTGLLGFAFSLIILIYLFADHNVRAAFRKP